MKMYKTLTTSLTVFALATFANCAYAAGELIGITLPNKTEARWVMDGNNIVQNLKAKGYKTDLQYSTYDVATQIAQIENMITSGAKVLIVSPVDAVTLSNVLQKAKLKGVKVISYDRLIMKTGNVDYYATFDNYQVGVLQATSIVKRLGLGAGKAHSILSCLQAHSMIITHIWSTRVQCLFSIHISQKVSLLYAVSKPHSPKWQLYAGTVH